MDETAQERQFQVLSITETSPTLSNLSKTEVQELFCLGFSFPIQKMGLLSIFKSTEINQLFHKVCSKGYIYGCKMPVHEIPCSELRERKERHLCLVRRRGIVGHSSWGVLLGMTQHSHSLDM